MKKTNKKGFTIVELVIVIAVIAILAGVMIPTFGGIIENANKNAALQDVKNAYSATLSNDLLTDGTDEVYADPQTEVIVVVDGKYYVKVDATGAASIVESGTATHTLETNGTLKKITA